MKVSNNKQAIMQKFLTTFGCPQTVEDRVDAYTSGGSTMLDFVCSLEQQEDAAQQQQPEPQKANIVQLMKDAKEEAPEGAME